MIYIAGVPIVIYLLLADATSLNATPPLFPTIPPSKETYHQVKDKKKTAELFGSRDGGGAKHLSPSRPWSDACSQTWGKVG